MDYNPMSFLDDLVSTRGDNIREKMMRFINRKIGTYTLRHFTYNLHSGILSMDLLDQFGKHKPFSGIVDHRVFQNSDYVLENYLHDRIQGA